MRTKLLNPKDLPELSAPGRYSDGGNLYYSIGLKGERRWTFLYKSRTERYEKSGLPKVVELGLGGAPGPDKDKPAVSLADARRKADALRKLLTDGKDPMEERQRIPAPLPVIVSPSVVAAERPAGQKDETFGVLADEYFESKKDGWKNIKHVNQWKRDLTVQCATLRPMMVRDITTDHVLTLLRPIFKATPESGKRLQERIEKVLNAATRREFRDGPNPARWVGHLKDTDLVTRKESDVKHHGAVPFADMPRFMRKLRSRDASISAYAFEWSILTTARTSEVILATWSEIDFEEKLWVVPPERMKRAKEHRVPLTDAALAVLEKMRPLTGGKPDWLIFPLSNMAMAELLKGMEGKGPTVHGTARSSFSDWANETTNHDSKIIDFCLAHINGDKAEKAYRRGDALMKRRAVLTDWASYLAG